MPPKEKKDKARPPMKGKATKDAGVFPKFAASTRLFLAIAAVIVAILYARTFQVRSMRRSLPGWVHC